MVAQYQQPCLRKSSWQMVNSIGPYLLLWIAASVTVQYSWPLTIALAALAGLFLVRIFIIFHDCGHGSALPRSRRIMYSDSLPGS